MGSSRNLWGTIAMAALAIFAPLAIGLIASGVTGLALTLGVVVGGGMLLSRELAASQPDNREPSQAYSWNQQTLQRPGGTLPKSYGRTRGHGNVIGCYTEEINTPYSPANTSIIKSEQRLNLLLDFGEGPVEGEVADSVLINGQAASSWPAVTTEFKRGLVEQTACTAFADELPVEIPIGIPVNHDDGPQVYSTPDAHFDDLEIVVECPKGLFYRNNDGGTEAYAVALQIEIAVKDSGAYATLVAETVYGYSFSPIRKTYRASNTYTGGSPVAVTRGLQYDVRVTKTSGDYDEGDYATRVATSLNLYAIREIITVGFTYPGRVLLAVSAIATEQLSGTLDLSVEFDGAIVNTDMTGGTTLAFSDNNAHVLADVLTMPVITGDGDEVYGEPYAIAEYRGPCTAGDPIWSTFAALAAYADALVDDGAGGTEKRLTFNGSFDTASTVGDAVTDVCAVSRCHLLWRGNRPYVQIDTARNPVMVLSDGNCRRNGRETLIPSAERASEVEIQFRDRNNDYQRTPLLVRNTQMAGSHKVVLQVNGVTKQSRAVRLMWFELKRNQYVNRQLRRAMQFDGFVLEPGDVVYAQRPGRYGGRLQAVTDRRVRLDREVKRTKADRIIVQTYDSGSGTWAIESHAVRWISGRLLEIKDDWENVTPRPDDVYLFGPDGISADLFEVQSIRRSGDLEFTLDLLTYDSRLFDADDNLPVLVADVGLTAPQRGGTPISAPATLAQVQQINPGAEYTSSVPAGGILYLKNNVRLYADANSVLHAQRLEGGVWVDKQVWGSASSSSSSSLSSVSSSSSSSSSQSSSSSSSGGA